MIIVVIPRLCTSIHIVLFTVLLQEAYDTPIAVIITVGDWRQQSCHVPKCVIGCQAGSMLLLHNFIHNSSNWCTLRESGCYVHLYSL